MSPRRPLVALALAFALAGCATPATPLHDVARAPLASPSTSPSPSESPSPSPSSSPKPPPPPKPPTPFSCAAVPGALSRSQATGTGPLGTTKTTGSAAVALTFDDGPDPVYTPRFLDLLAQCGVKATFCLVGSKVAANPGIVQRMVREGHTLCNHTWNHIRQLGTYGPDLIRQDLQKTLDAIHAAVPGAKVPYFRAPGGAWTQDYITVAHELGMTPLHWDVDPWDWNFDAYGHGASMVNHIIGNVEGNVRPGSVILSHDYQKPDTLTAYRTLIPWLKGRVELIPLPSGGLG